MFGKFTPQVVPTPMEIEPLDMPLVHAVREALGRARATLASPDEFLRLVVGVSGGEDSHTLLHILRSLQTVENLELYVAHFDHKLRPESAKEAKFVASLASKYGLPFLFREAQDRPEGENLEAWARMVRYQFLRECLHSSRCDFIVTAHHQNDQAETVLFRLLTGRMLTEAYAIAGLDPEQKLLRPLLDTSREEIEDYSTINRLSFVVDSSNEELERTRNRIRQQLIPALREAYNPSIVNTLSSVSNRLTDDENALWGEARRILQEELDAESVSYIKLLVPALRWRVLQLIAERHCGENAAKLGYRRLVNLADEIVQGPRFERPIDIGFGLIFLVDRYSRVHFRWKDLELDGAPPLRSVEVSELQPSLLPIPGEVLRRYRDGTIAKIQARVVPRTELQNGRAMQLARQQSSNAPSAASAYFDARSIANAVLVVRERRDGDQMRVMNRGGRKLKKLLQEQRVVLSLRNQLPLVEWDGNILWVPGIARADIAPISDSSDLLLELSYVRESLS